MKKPAQRRKQRHKPQPQDDDGYKPFDLADLADLMVRHTEKHQGSIQGNCPACIVLMGVDVLMSEGFGKQKVVQ